MMKIEFGKFEIESGIMVISDPTLDLRSPFQVKDLVVKSGIWLVEVEKTNFDRCAEIIIYHEDHDSDDILDEINCDIHIGSGQVGIYDQEHYFGSDDDWVSINKDNSDDLVGIIEYGVVGSPDECSGEYKLFVKKDDEDIIGIRLVFICEEEDEEEFLYDDSDESESSDDEEENLY